MLTIHQARPTDWPDIQSGLARTHLDEGVLTADVSATNLVAHIAGRFAGFCMIEHCGDMAVLPALFVESAFRGQGVAGHLVATCVAHAASKGARRVFTGCQDYGVPFLERQGFEVERREFVPIGVLTRLESSGGTCLTLFSMKLPNAATPQETPGVFQN